jgi:membrane protease YdiL (CAAX protease family)
MTEPIAHPSERPEPTGSMLDRHRTAAFFLLTIAISWVLWLPLAVEGLVDSLPIPPTALVVAGGFGPMLAAAVLTWATGDSLRAWASQALRWRVRPRWYLLAIGVPIAATAIWAIALATTGVPIDPSVLSERLVGYVSAFVFVFFLGGGQEELGWRGFALPRLQAEFGASIASVVIGVVWAIWHLPLIAVPGAGASGGGVVFLAYAVGVVGLSFVFTWVYNGTGGSVLLAMVLHAGVNTAGALMPVRRAAAAELSPVVLTVVQTGAFWLVALAVLVVSGRRLSHGSEDAVAGTPRSLD